MPVYTCKKKEKYDQLILEMYTRVELPFKVEGGGGGGGCTSHLHPQYTFFSFLCLYIHVRRKKSMIN